MGASQQVGEGIFIHLMNSREDGSRRYDLGLRCPARLVTGWRNARHLSADATTLVFGMPCYTQVLSLDQELALERGYNASIRKRITRKIWIPAPVS